MKNKNLKNTELLVFSSALINDNGTDEKAKDKRKN